MFKALISVNIPAQALCTYSMFGAVACFVMHTDEHAHILSQLDPGEWGKNTTAERTCRYCNFDVTFLRPC